MRALVWRAEGVALWGFLAGLAVSITLAQVALGALALCWVLRLAEPGRAGRLPFPLAGPLLAWAGASLLATLAARGASVAALAAARDLLLAATFYLMLHACRERGGAAPLLDRLLALMGAVGALAIVQVAVCPADPGWLPLGARFFKRCDRAHAFYSIYMTLAGVLGLVLLAAAPRLVAAGRGRLAWRPVAWMAAALALALTQVRGAWLGAGAGLLALAALVRRGRALALAAVAAAVLLLIVAPGLRGRAASILDPADPTARERLYMWQSGWAIALDHPVFGVGPGRLKDVYPAYARPGAIRRSTSHVHQTPLQVLAERGALGLAAWLWLWVAFFRAGFGARARATTEGDRALVAGSLAALAGFLVSGLFEHNWGDSEVAMAAWAVMAVPFLVEGAPGGATGAAAGATDPGPGAGPPGATPRG